MKNIIKKSTLILMAMGLGFISCKERSKVQLVATNINTEVEKPNFDAMPVLTFENTEHDFGTIKRGQAQSTIFKFTNTGKSPLIITDVKVSCGCTAPSYPKNKPIAPGKSGEIQIAFNGIGRNQMTKGITVIANTVKTEEVLRVKAFIAPLK